ncbi:MAG: hypothetical protein Q4D38_00935 [Planctomycetia bacterium]|nr:hypothetical protein [Planctomycetia bacterium]
MTQNIAALEHIQMDRVAVGFCQTRKDVRHGMQASLTPLRFENGSLTSYRRGRKYTLQRILNEEGIEYLYILNLYLPRFLENDFKEKLVTIVHELLHISPEFNGDIRRFEGRCYAHSSSQKDFDAYAELLAKLWLAKNPPRELYDFLHFNFQELNQKYRGIIGRRYPTPKLIRVSE